MSGCTTGSLYCASFIFGLCVPREYCRKCARDITLTHVLLHGQLSDMFAASGRQGVDKHDESKVIDHLLNRHPAMTPGKCEVLNLKVERARRTEQLEKPRDGVQNSAARTV